MNIIKKVPLADLKEGELYFEEAVWELHEYNIAIVKIQKSNPEEEQIMISVLEIEDFSLFSNVFDLTKKHIYSSSKYDFFETYIKVKHHPIKYYYYEFDEEWFFKNKEKILFYLRNRHLIKTFPEIFQEIESRKNEHDKISRFMKFKYHKIMFFE